MTSLLKSLLGIMLTVALVPASSFAQTDTPDTPQPVTTKKKKSAKVKAVTPAPAGATEMFTPSMPDTKSTTMQEPSAGVRVAPGEVLNFNTDNGVPAPKDNAQVSSGYTFKASDEPMQASPVTYDTVNDDAGFKTYIGYPKHRFSVDANPKGVAAVWNFQGADFNFRSQTTGYGVAYDFVATPRFGMGVEYNHSSLTVDSAKAVNNRFNINSSSATYDTYFIRTHYCYFGTTNFALQYCPEFAIGNDAYPILSFAGNNSTLAMDKVQDLVVGVSLKIQVPVADKILFHVTPGYTMGTGIGNSGALTSKNNSTLYGLLGVGYEFNVHNALGLEGAFLLRNAKLSGKAGSFDETWTTKSTEIGAKLVYTYTL